MSFTTYYVTKGTATVLGKAPSKQAAIRKLLGRK